jgi:putative membrane protein insertion efficiency factor
MLTFIKYIFSQLLILPVRFYQLAISPLLGSNCRHAPSCSQYTIEAIREWGPLKGGWMGAKRISRCHPWGTHGYDPVPKKPAK